MESLQKCRENNRTRYHTQGWLFLRQSQDRWLASTTRRRISLISPNILEEQRSTTRSLTDTRFLHFATNWSFWFQPGLRTFVDHWFYSPNVVDLFSSDESSLRSGCFAIWSLFLWPFITFLICIQKLLDGSTTPCLSWSSPTWFSIILMENKQSEQEVRVHWVNCLIMVWILV